MPGQPAPGYSSGDSLDAIEEVAQEILPKGYTISWIGTAYQEKQISGSSTQAFVFGIVFLFLILAALYRAHPKRFNIVTEICGRDRLYFANSEAELAASGSSTKPKQIPDSPFWVLTNSNTTRKKMMLTRAASSLGYNDVDVEKIRELL